MPQPKKTREELERLRAFSWVAYMMSHEPEEMKKLFKYGTPSDKLISKSTKSILMITSEGRSRKIFFPVSLNTSKGQKMLYKTARRVELFLKTVPTQMYDLLIEIKATLKVRRADAFHNILAVAEAVLYRAACEFKHEVLFAFDSINTWVKSVYGKELGYLTIRKALETLQANGFIKVNEWGKRGSRSRCTKIEVIPLQQNNVLAFRSEVDDWLLYNDYAMAAVYRRESTTRQDVLEACIHTFAEKEAERLEKESHHPRDARLFPPKDAKIVVAASSGAEEPNFEEFYRNETYVNRLLGGLVFAVQTYGTDDRQVGAGIRGPD